MGWINIETYMLTDIIDILEKVENLMKGTEKDIRYAQRLCRQLRTDITNALLDEHLCPFCGADLEYAIDRHDGHRIIKCSECEYEFE